MDGLLELNNTENTLVHAVLHGDDGQEYECAGILMKETEDIVQIAFNAIDGNVKDSLDISKSDIIRIQKIDPLELWKIK